KADQLREREADWIARRIRELLDDSTPRVRERDPVGGEMKLRPVQPGDIVLLFRGLTNVAVYEEALRRWGLDYYLVGGRAFYAQQEIYDIVNLLSYVDDADDFVSLVGALRSPFFSLSDDTLLALSQQPGGWETFVTQSVPEDLPDDQREQVQHAKDVFRELTAFKDRLSLVELMQAAFELTGYDASLLHEFLGKRKLANLRKLVDLARSFDQAGVFTLKDFVQRLRTAVEDETDEEFAALHAEQTQILRLMTIHQSKGLEFPVVFVAQMNWQPRGGRSQVYFHPEFGALLSRTTQIGELPKSIAQHMHAHHEQKEDASEVIRLLYVAMTRAADHLVLSAGFRQPPQWENKLSPWMSLLRERFDLSTGLPAGDPYLGQFLKGEATADDAPITTPAIPEIKVHLHAPEAKRPNERESTALRPSQFAEVAAQSEPAAFPALYGPVTVTANATGEYSVSAIETAYPLPLTEAASASNAKLFDEKTDGDESEPLLPATELGTAMHLALEWIDFECREPLAELVGRIFATQIPQPSAEIAHAVTRRLNVLHQSALWTELQQSRQCWRELDFLLTWPISKANDPAAADVIRGTIDCLYESAAGELIVRDYKTIPWNRPPDAAGLTHYAIQLGLYAFAVQQMFGRLPDRVELVFLGRRATQQSFTPTSGDLSHIARQVDAAITQLRAGSPAVLPK
ncbi:MAG: 3'-5' exonuclease, partial [Planctomycetaceae bacterium]